MNVRTIIISILSICAHCVSTTAQPPDTLWSRFYFQDDYEFPYVFCPASDGGYLMAGGWEISGSQGETHGFARRVDSLGNEIWCRQYYLNQYTDKFYAGCATQDGGFALTGYSQEWPNGIWVVRIDNNGDTLWTTRPQVSTGYGFGIQELAAGGFLVTGSGDDESRPPPNTGSYWLKLSESGDSLWTQFFIDNDYRRTELYGIAPTNDGGHILAGYMTFSIQQNPTVGLLIRINSSGDTVWTRRYTTSIGSTIFHPVCATLDGNFMTMGPAGFGCCVMKFTAQGDSLWTRNYRNHELTGWSRMDIQQTPDSGFILSSTTRGLIWTAALFQKSNANGDSLWSWTRAGDNQNWVGVASILLPDGGMAALCEAEVYTGPYTNLCYLVRFAPDTNTSVVINTPEIVSQMSLGPAYPNPFNSSTQIRFELSKNSQVELRIVNTLGQRVAVLVDERRNTGSYTVPWEASRLASGIYFAQLRAGEQSRVAKMMLIR